MIPSSLLGPSFLERLHHIGLATADVEGSLNIIGYDKKDIQDVIEDNKQGNRLYFVAKTKTPTLWLEIVEPIAPYSTVGNFVRKTGGGWHHMGITTSDLDAEDVVMKSKGGVFALGRYTMDVPVFGGMITTSFWTFGQQLIELVAPPKAS
jgi:hypothetical protein